MFRAIRREIGSTRVQAALWGMIALLIGMAAPADAQGGGGGGGGRSRRAIARDVQVVVDSVVRITWDDASLRRLAERNEGPNWKSKGRDERPTVSVWALLKEADVPRDTIQKVEIYALGKLVVSASSEALATLDPLVLRRAPRADRPWKLARIGPGSRFSQSVVERIEVTTTAEAK